MKTAIKLLTLSSVVLMMMVWQGCNKTDETRTGTIEFGLNPQTKDALKSALPGTPDVTYALVTIVDFNGEKVYDKEQIQFYSFGDSYVTRSLTLNAGKYQLTEFMLADSSGRVNWATPVEGSNLAGLVNDPLPIEFVVFADNTTQVYPQVVRVASHNPEDFGYVRFHVDFIDKFCFDVYYESLCSDWARDSAMFSPTGFAPPYLPAKIIIYAEGHKIAESYLLPGMNRVMAPDGYDRYRIVVLDCGNQRCYEEAFSREALGNYACRNDMYLAISCLPELPEVIITPEGVGEPTIEQGVFGQITEPWWDSTATEEYVVRPMVTELYLYKIQEGDSIYFPTTADGCIAYPDLNLTPLAIVRSNSAGYYQLPMEAGQYRYLVKTPVGFYIDAYVSSHLPGFFEVHTGEITFLNIHVQQCAWY